MRSMRSLSRLVAVGIVAAAASPDAIARAAGRQGVIVGIALGGPASAAARLVPALVEEADRIWRARDVRIVSVDGTIPAREDVRITLTFGSLAAAARPLGGRGEPTSGLGSIWFDENGSPGDTITVDDRAVAEKIAEVKVNNRPLADWPPAIGDRVVGRALGRVLAHELGHYLLRSKMHQTSGLMRAAFSDADLASWERTRFRLDSNVLPRLRANLARILLQTDHAIAANGQPLPSRVPVGVDR
jgi:hypothetical protein